MKLKKLGLFALTLGLGLSLASCGDEQTEVPVDPDKPEDPTPSGDDTKSEVETKAVANVTYAKDTKTVSWDKVNGATNYVINIDGTVFNSKTTSLELSDEFLLPYDGCHMEIKVYAENSTEKGSYSEAVLVLVGEDKITDAEFTQAFTNLGLKNLTEAELKEFLTKNGITKKELWNISFGDEQAIVSKGVSSKIQAFLYQHMLDEMYIQINPTWQEGQDKKLVQYVEENFDEVSQALATMDSLTGLMKNKVLKDALGRFADIQDGKMDVQGLLDLYSNVQQQLDEAIPSEEDIEQLVSLAKEVCPILLEENSTYAVNAYYTIYPKEAEGLQTAPESLTKEQLAKLTEEINGILDSLETTLDSVVDLTQDIYSSLSEEALEDIANVNQTVTEQSKFLLTDEMKEFFKTNYLSSIIEKSLLETFQKDEVLNQVTEIISDLDTVAKKEAVVNLLDTMLPPMLEETPAGQYLAGVKPSVLLQGVLEATTKEELTAFLDTVDLVVTPALDVEYLAASAYNAYYSDLYYEIESDSKLTPEEKQQEKDKINQLTNEANIILVKGEYSAIRNLYTNMSDEMLDSISSELEGIVTAKLIEEFEASKVMNADEIKNLQMSLTMLDESIAAYDPEIQEIEALYPTETTELARLFNELKEIQIQADKNPTQENYDLVSAKNQEISQCLVNLDAQDSTNYERHDSLNAYCDLRRNILYLELQKSSINTSIEEYTNSNNKLDAYIQMVNDFVATEHDYTANYAKILKDIRSLMTNLTPEELEECMTSTLAENDFTDAAVIKVANLIVSTNDGELLEDIIANVKVVAANEALVDMDLITMIEENVDPIVAAVLEVGTYSPTGTLTAEQTENVNLIKELIGSLFM